MELATKFPLGAPESLLPSSRDAVEAAIVEYTKCLHARDLLTAKTYDQLCIGYTVLACFIPDSEAAEGAKAFAAMSADEPDALGEDTGKAMARHQRVLGEQDERRNQFKQRMAREGISLPVPTNAPLTKPLERAPLRSAAQRQQR
jgi:hypothetical protein